MKLINKVKYQLLKMREAYEAKKNLTIEIPDDEYERLIQYDIVDFPIVNPEPEEPETPSNNYYIGRSNKEVFTLDDLDQYVAEKPSEITLPGGDRTTWAVWIYPEAWGKPTKAVSNHSNADELASFIYADLTLPEGYTGCYSLPGVDDTYTLEW